MMKKDNITISGIPAVIWGPDADKGYIFVHGKMGSKEDAGHFAEIAVAKGYQVVSFDLPEHGERRDEDYPVMAWNGVKDLRLISDFAVGRWQEINLYACSLGVYFSLLAYQDINLKKSLFQCPLLNMERLIQNMMGWFQISEEELQARQEIATPIGEVLYWDYYMYAKEHPVDQWHSETYILYPSEDNLTERTTVDEFIQRNQGNLTVLEGAEHFFTDQEHQARLESWLQNMV